MSNKRVLSVYREGEQLKLKRVTTNSVDCSLIARGTLFLMLHIDLLSEVEEGYVLKLQSMEQPMETTIEGLLDQYKDIFEELIELPTSRGIELQIVLKPNSCPKHQYPYRTSHSHKDEIERIVKELLESGFIQHNKSPFSSPVILVKKKDNSCRMCVD